MVQRYKKNLILLFFDDMLSHAKFNLFAKRDINWEVFHPQHNAYFGHAVQVVGPIWMIFGGWDRWKCLDKDVANSYPHQIITFIYLTVLKFYGFLINHTFFRFNTMVRICLIKYKIGHGVRSWEDKL